MSTPEREHQTHDEQESAALFTITAERNPENPIVEAVAELPWADRKVYNPSETIRNGLYHMVFRAVGNKDNISRLGYAISPDGITYAIRTVPFLEPQGEDEALGVEDPRITLMEESVVIDGKEYPMVMTYTGVKPWTAQVKLVGVSDDFQEVSRRIHMFPRWDMDKPEEERDLWNTPHGRPIIFPGFDPRGWEQGLYGNWTKAAGIFPKKINGRYYALWGEYRIRAASSKDLEHWTVVDEPVIGAREGKFDAAYVEMGAAPIEIDDGWLVFYNGINSLEQKGRVYGIGWAVLAKDDPTRVIARGDIPILVPQREDEISGEIDIALIDGKTIHQLTPEEFAKHKESIPMAVFCNSAVSLENNRFALAYGAADKRIKRAIVTLTKAV